jgi:toxin ParE1/3/4
MQFHLRHCPNGALREGRVQRPRHAVYYRVAKPGLIDILRVLHDRMDPRRHVDNDN